MQTLVLVRSACITNIIDITISYECLSGKMRASSFLVYSLAFAFLVLNDASAQVRSLTPPATSTQNQAPTTPAPQEPVVVMPPRVTTPVTPQVVLPTPAVAAPIQPTTPQAATQLPPPPAPVITAPKVEDQALSQATNKEIFDNFKKSITPVKINEQEEPYKIEYEIPRKSFKKDLSEVSKDLKFKLVDKSDKEEFSNLMLDAYKASLSGQLEASVAIYKKALKEDGKNTNILFALASLYHKLMQYPEARSYYKKLLTIDPNYKKAMNNYLALMSEETPSMALTELLELERANPQYSPVIAQIGMVYAKLGQYDKADEYLKRAVTLSPEVAAYRYNLAVVYDQMNRYSDAMTLYRQVLDTNYTYEILPQSRAAIKDRVDYLQTKISIQQPNN
jgi:tetratricopeptide (TPR) repeat protein